jgi:hypothetical protein
MDRGEIPIIEAYARALPVLHRVERYQHRAFSRQKKAARQLNDLRLLSRWKSGSSPEYNHWE